MNPMGKGTCAHCGAPNVALVGLRATGSDSSYAAQRLACSWCFYADRHGVVEIARDFDDEEPTRPYKRDELVRAIKQTGGGL